MWRTCVGLDGGWSFVGSRDLLSVTLHVMSFAKLSLSDKTECVGGGCFFFFLNW